LLTEMGENGAWWRLGFDSAVHYAEERLGLSRTAVRSRMLAARKLRRLPVVRQAYEDGRIGIETTLHIVRALSEDMTSEAVQQAWVDRGIEATVKRFKDEARAMRADAC
jgi:uncharacterized protein DUF222